MTVFNAPNPGMSIDGDDDPAEDLWDQSYWGPAWVPASRYKSPEDMVHEDRAWLNHNMAAALAAGKRHSQPPCPPSWVRPL